ncbi:MAG: ABC transporter ATP-binding protein [Fibrella sp.]|nr:ABC transporter ATP-binding protein [Armatimonadota bacterium]
MPTANTPSPATDTPSVTLRGIGKTFGSLVALADVSLTLVPGSRHAIVGENGAGKSTLMKVLFGGLRPDTGEVLLQEKPVRFVSPQDAIAAGIGMVHQHFELIPPFTVAENVVLGAEVGGFVLNQSEAEKRVRELAEESGLPIDPTARVETLSVAAQQRTEILKALYRRAKVLILDEPTATLAPSEARDLWAAAHRLSDAGTTVVFITHKLDDVMAHAETVTVLRRGEHILTKSVSETNPVELARAMVGDGSIIPGALTPSPAPSERRGEPDKSFAGSEASPASPSGSRLPFEGAGLGVRDLTVLGSRGETVVNGVSLEVRPGEIVGLAGVDGSGQVDLIEAIVGLRQVTSGTILLGKAVLNCLNVAQRRAVGIGYVPEDRHHRAMVLPLSLEENAVLGRHRESAFADKFGFLNVRALREFLAAKTTAFDVRGVTVGNPARSLSGGNQQKLVMARELSRTPDLLLASQPTRGLDFGATAFVHDALRRERDRGAAVLVQSLDLAEVLALSDRVAVMLGGKIVGVLNKADATEERVGALMTGASDQ